MPCAFQLIWAEELSCNSHAPRLDGGLYVSTADRSTTHHLAPYGAPVTTHYRDGKHCIKLAETAKTPEYFGRQGFEIPRFAFSFTHIKFFTFSFSFFPASLFSLLCLLAFFLPFFSPQPSPSPSLSMTFSLFLPTSSSISLHPFSLQPFSTTQAL